MFIKHAANYFFCSARCQRLHKEQVVTHLIRPVDQLLAEIKTTFNPERCRLLHGTDPKPQTHKYNVSPGSLKHAAVVFHDKNSLGILVLRISYGTMHFFLYLQTCFQRYSTRLLTCSINHNKREITLKH